MTPALAGFLTLAYLFMPPHVQQERLIVYVAPVYPQLAKAARIEGTVRMAGLIDEHGEVDRLRLISGHPLLVRAAFDAVKQWRYRPATQDGLPAAVATTIEVTFSLGLRGRHGGGIVRRI